MRLAGNAGVGHARRWRPPTRASGSRIRGRGTPGWACLRFSMDGPQYYQYEYDATATSFSAIAHGDLNGNTVESTFTLAGSVVEDTTGEFVVTVAPSISEVNPEE